MDTLNLRPLPNRLGHNGIYMGVGTPVEQDCARMEGHTDLFRNLERFEVDLREAVSRIWDDMTLLHVTRQRVADGFEPIDVALGVAIDNLDMAFQYMREAYLVAEVLDDRERGRLRNRDRKDFLDLISTTPREEMAQLDRLEEEARLTWQISALLDRLNEVCHVERREWPKIDREALARFVERLDRLTNPPSAETLQTMTDEELANELRTLESRISDARKAITLIHAIKVVRNA